jgi:predicted TIM-barrel fold metal-dependent hydrolase
MPCYCRDDGPPPDLRQKLYGLLEATIPYVSKEHLMSTLLYGKDNDFLTVLLCAFCKSSERETLLGINLERHKVKYNLLEWYIDHITGDLLHNWGIEKEEDGKSKAIRDYVNAIKKLGYEVDVQTHVPELQKALEEGGELPSLILKGCEIRKPYPY